MTIERRIDFLWGLIEGESKVLDPGSVVEREILLDGNYKTSQTLTILTPDLVHLTTPYMGIVRAETLLKEEVNSYRLPAAVDTLWDALRGKRERLGWKEDTKKHGKKLKATALFDLKPSKCNF